MWFVSPLSLSKSQPIKYNQEEIFYSLVDGFGQNRSIFLLAMQLLSPFQITEYRQTTKSRSKRQLGVVRGHCSFFSALGVSEISNLKQVLINYQHQNCMKYSEQQGEKRQKLYHKQHIYHYLNGTYVTFFPPLTHKVLQVMALHRFNCQQVDHFSRQLASRKCVTSCTKHVSSNVDKLGNKHYFSAL